MWIICKWETAAGTTTTSLFLKLEKTSEFSRSKFANAFGDVILFEQVNILHWVK